MAKAKLYDKYPVSSLFIYNGSTILHFLIGGLILMNLFRLIGITGIIIAIVYMLLSFLEMYVLMPLQVCNNCVYFRSQKSVCISGLNLIAKAIAKPGNPLNFPNRARGFVCPNNLYIISLVFPIVVGAIILFLKFNLLLLIMELSLIVLLMTRFFYIIPTLACLHCQSKFVCPQAGQMGVREK
jgi:hypothetical protein